MTNTEFSQEVRSELCAGIAAGREAAEIEIALEGSVLWARLTTDPKAAALAAIDIKIRAAEAENDRLYSAGVRGVALMLAANQVFHYMAKRLIIERGLAL